MSRRLLLLLGVLLAGGCAVSKERAGREIPSVTGQLHVGKTTKAEALALLGPPVSVRRQFDGDLLIWRRTASESVRFTILPSVFRLYDRTDGSSSSDLLALLFDRTGTLSGLGVQRDVD